MILAIAIAAIVALSTLIGGYIGYTYGFEMGQMMERSKRH